MTPVAVISGASRGLGLAIAGRLIRKGYEVHGLSKTTRSWKKARATVQHAEKLVLHKVDVTSEKEVRRLAALLKTRVKSVDLLINNAGYGGGLSTVEKTATGEIEKHFQQNLLSAFLMAKYFLPLLPKRKKSFLLNIASMAAQRAVPRLFGYSSAKFGMRALTQCLAKENEKSRTKFLTICPGGMNTTMRSDLFGKKDAAKQQGVEFVAGIIEDVLDERIPLASGSDIVIRHGKISAIHPLPGI